MVAPAPRITGVAPVPVDEAGLRQRLHLTVVALAAVALGVVELALAMLTLLCLVLAPTGVGLALANLVVPATQWVTAQHRRVAGELLGEVIEADYAPTDGRGPLGRPLLWVRDGRRWRDAAFLAFAGTGGLVMAGVPVVLLATLPVHLTGLLLDGGSVWLVLTVVGLAAPAAWWVVTPPLVRARALVERALLGHARVERLERRVEEVSRSRAESLDHSAAELRRIERDLHDGAQARMTAVGLNVGMAERLVATDPEAAAELLREARETTLSALAELRSLVRGIHPPALADLGLVGGVESLAEAVPVPVTTALALPGRAPLPVEAAVYFAVAECVANLVKHAGATRAWIRLDHAAGRLRVEVGDDGRGGADPGGSGLAGVARRLAAFDGTMQVASPADGPTVITMEVPCRLDSSSPRTRPSSATD